MNQRTHAWLALRAVALLEQKGQAKKLVQMLKPHVKSAAIGAWIPDLQDSKKGSGDIDNHILKMKPYDGTLKNRFKISRQKLLGLLGSERRMTQYLKADTTLDGDWWNTPYKAEPQPGQHLANRAMALTTTLIDQLILGDPAVAGLVPGTVRFISNVDMQARTRAQQAATYFFMLSHFVADSCMPCHCDARSLAQYKGGLHKEFEARWSRGVGTYFEKNKLLACGDSADTILQKARDVDKKFGLKFNDPIPGLYAKDVWSEMVHVCRASFALDNIVASPSKYPFGKNNTVSLKKIAATAQGEKLIAGLDEVVMHDAVLNVAIVWKHIWDSF